jgi:DNA-binding transcriptional LysR family regulator
MRHGIDWEARIGRRLRLRDLHAFFIVVKWRSMAKAAEELGVSQPAISKVIGDLEHALGVRLVDRSRRGVEPTIYGNALLKRGLVAFDELRQGIKDIEFLSDPTAGELTIGCADSIAATILRPIIERFYQRHPRAALRTEMVPSPAINDPGLQDRRYDLVLGRQPMPLGRTSDDLRVEHLFDDHLIVAAGMHTPWARRRKVDPSSVLALHAERRLLKELPVGFPATRWPVAIVILKNRTMSPLAERFIECAREVTRSFGSVRARGRAGR